MHIETKLFKFAAKLAGIPSQTASNSGFLIKFAAKLAGIPSQIASNLHSLKQPYSK